MSAHFPEPDEWHINVANNLANSEISCLPRCESDGKIIVFDCGANRGLWAQGFLSRYPDAAVDIHLFEPSERNVSFIRNEHERIFGPTRKKHHITINQQAVGERTGQLDLYSDWEGSWVASLTKRDDIEVSKSEKVKITTIDSYTRERNIERIDFLKLDVEGWELAALHGCDYLLNAQKIEKILFEFSSVNVYTRVFFLDFWKLLTPLGYRFFHVVEHETRPILHYDGEWEKHWGTSLYFATLETKVEL